MAKLFTILVSPNERAEMKSALGEYGFEIPIPFDFLLYTSRGPIPRERKVFPGDFLASIGDGRFAKECAAMREISQYPGIILEGSPNYNSEGILRVNGRFSRWNKKGIRNMIRSLKYVESCDVEWSDSIEDTVEILKENQEYFDNPRHLSLRRRQKFESDWYSPVYEERFIFWLQGCGKGISVTRARLISQKFKTPMEVGQAFADETLRDKLMELPGIGKVIADNFCKFWSGESG